MNIAELKGQIQVIEAQRQQAIRTIAECDGALKMARHMLARSEYVAKIQSEASNAKVAAETDAPALQA